MSVVRTTVADGIGRITLDRPDAMNAVTVALGAELEQALRELGDREDVTVVAVRGAGGNFSAGGDFHEVQRLQAGGPEALAPLFENFGRACAAAGEIAPPVVAIVEGVAMAGGFEFCQAADIVLVRDDARLADNHVNFGQVPGGGGSQRLARLIGRHRALGHLLDGSRWSGVEAVAQGLAYRSWPEDVFDDEVEAFLTRLAGRRRDALVSIKRLVREGLELDLDAGLDLELRTVIDHISGEAGSAGFTTFSKGERP